MSEAKFQIEAPKPETPVDVFSVKATKYIEESQAADQALIDEVRSELAPFVLSAEQRMKIFNGSAPEIRQFIDKVQAIPWDKIGGKTHAVRYCLTEMELLLSSTQNQFQEAKNRIESLNVSQLKGQGRQWVPSEIISLLGSSDGALSRLDMLRSQVEDSIRYLIGGR